MEQYSALVERAHATTTMAACQASSRREVTTAQYDELVQAAQQASAQDLTVAAPNRPLIDNDATMENGGALDTFVAQLPVMSS